MAIIGPAIGAVFSGANLLSSALGLGLSLALNYFFPQKVEGPRAESLKAQTSKYGDPIARGYGTYRTAGAVIWLKGDKVDEHKKTERQGKALGPVVTSYSYTATFAVAFCWDGPIDAIPRIWADNKLIYDNSAATLQDAIDGTVTSKALGTAKGATITIYLGTSTQTADATIEADKGSGNVPAWRGVAYVVIQNLPLDEFGIRVPNIEAEIVNSGQQSFISLPLTDTDAGSYSSMWGDYFATNDRSTNHFSIQKLPTGSYTLDTTLSYAPNGVHVVGDTGFIVVSSTSTGYVYVYDAATGTLAYTLTATSGGAAATSNMSSIAVGSVTYVVIEKFGAWTILKYDGATWSSLFTEALSFGSAWLFIATISIGPDYIYATSTGAGGTPYVLRVAWTEAGLGTKTALAWNTWFAERPVHVSYDQSTDVVIMYCGNGIMATFQPDLSAILVSTTSLTWGGALITNDEISSSRTETVDGIFTMTTPDHTYVLQIDISDLSIVGSYQASSWADISSFMDKWQYSATWNALINTDRVTTREIYFLPKYASLKEYIRDWIQAECNHAGVDSDVTGVSPLGYGYGIRDQAPPRGVIEDICRVNFVDFTQIDGVLTFFDRKTSSARTLTVNETGIGYDGEANPRPVIETWPARIDVPEQVIITYPSHDAYYRLGSQSGTVDTAEVTQNEPTSTDQTGAIIRSRRPRSLEISTAQVFTDDEAAQIADIMYGELRDAASLFKTTLGIKHIDLAPGYVVTLPLDTGRTIDTVITKMTGEIVIEAEFRKRGNAYTSNAVGQTTPAITQTLLGRATATMVLIDGNLLRAADDNDGFYAAVAPTDSGDFVSTSVYRSTDMGDTYDPWAAFTVGAERGLARTALPDRLHPEAFDRASSFIVAFPQGTVPSSVSEATLLSDTTINVFAVYNSTISDWEYIRAATIVDNGDFTWTLSTLLRGRNGTEFAMAGHAIGDVVIHIESTSLLRTTDGDRSLSRIYVPVPSGTVFDESNASTFTNTAKGLRPWAPTDPKVTRNGAGDLSGNFKRRDRLIQQWAESGAEDPPMSETTELYYVKVYNGTSYATVKRTIQTNGEAWTYTAADQVADFGSPQDEIYFGIAQVSATYGAGIEERFAA